jgi:hypothetical protein
MLKTFVSLVCLGGLTLACEEPHPPTVAFQYTVRGSGHNVKITYLTEDAGLVNRTVSLPWPARSFGEPNNLLFALRPTVLRGRW